MKTSADVGVLRHCNSDSYPDRLGFTPVNSRLSVEDWSRCGLDTYPPLVLDLNVRSVVDLNVRFATKALGESVVFRNIRFVVFDL
jgi:hypothetical protein